MSRHDKTALIAALEIVAAYIATHPHAPEAMLRIFYLRLAHLCRLTAEQIGLLAIYAERRYADLSA